VSRIRRRTAFGGPFWISASPRSTAGAILVPPLSRMPATRCLSDSRLRAGSAGINASARWSNTITEMMSWPSSRSIARAVARRTRSIFSPFIEPLRSSTKLTFTGTRTWAIICAGVTSSSR
jgi:hypothetical protein